MIKEPGDGSLPFAYIILEISTLCGSRASALMLLNDARKGVFCCPNFRTYNVVDCIQATGASGPKNEKERRQRIWI